MTQFINAEFPFGPDFLGPPAACEESLVYEATHSVMRKAQSGTDMLPAFPPLGARLLQVLRQESPETRDVVQIVGSDPSIAALIVRTANSSFYARRLPVATLRDAVVRIGAQTASKIAFAAATRDLFDIRQRTISSAYEPIRTRLWHHAMTVAFAASRVAFELQCGDVQKVFLAGMLHDIGKTVGLHQIIALVSENPDCKRWPRRILEIVLQITHEALAAKQLKAWGLPEEIVAVCAKHHQAVPDPSLRNLHCVRAVAACDTLLAGDAFARQSIEEVSESLEVLGLGSQHHARVFDTVESMRWRVKELLSGVRIAPG